ncbi:MAG: DUF4277 domain-containing protein [Cyanobacteria bacterium SBC]|nr:DUF4277 domain-containing protein [Cyanobacteria bacterium SBC]
MSAEIKNLDHLGLVAGIIDDLGIVGIINDLLGEKKTEKVSAGIVVKAMSLNGMGLVSSGASQNCKLNAPSTLEFRSVD